MPGRGHGGREEEENKKVVKGSSYKCGVGADYLVSILLLPLTSSVILGESYPFSLCLAYFSVEWRMFTQETRVLTCCEN